MGVIEPDVLL